MPELSKPLIAILGVVISVAILFIAVAGFLPFFQQAVTGPAQQAQFTATATPSAAGTNIVIFSVNVQKVVGTGTYNITNETVVVIDPNGVEYDYNDQGTFYMDRNVTFTAATVSASFTIKIKLDTDYTPGTWVIIINVVDTDGNPVQTINLQVRVT